MRRWYGGGWQNLLKHHRIIQSPIKAFELSLIYVEGVTFSVLLFIIPLLNLWLGVRLLASYLVAALFFGVWAARKAKRWDLVVAPIPYMFLLYVNSYVFLEQFIVEALWKKKTLKWFKPERKHMEYV